MSKSTFFTGQPIFNQVLNFIPRTVVQSVVRDMDSDRYFFEYSSIGKVTPDDLHGLKKLLTFS